MRHSKAMTVAALAISVAVSSTAQAVYTYNFDNISGSPTPGTLLIPGSPTPPLGTVGQDNWVLASGVSSYVRNDPPAGFSGNFLAGAPADLTVGGQDSIETRVDGPFGSLGLGGQRYVTLQFDGLVGFAGYNNASGNPVSRRSEIAPGVDANLSGQIRGTSASSENGEVGPQFGFESTGSGWYVRRAAYSNTGTVTAATTAQGVWRMQLVIDLNANPSTVADQVHGGFVNDGAGTLYVKQLADANGNPVNDVFRLAAATTANVNLGLSGMGGLGGADPANWNGYSTRTAQNGGIDNIVFFNGLPASTSTWVTDAGDWLNSGNWYIGVPNGVGAVAEFTFGARTNATVYADSAVTVGTLNIGNTSSYNLTGNGSLTLQTSSGNAAVNVTLGSQKINLPLIVASNTTLNVSSGATLRISDPVTVNAGRSITQTGTGSVIYESTISVLSGGSIMIGGDQHIAGLTLGTNANAALNAPAGGGTSVARFDALSFASGSKFDVGTGEVRAPGTQAGTLALIQSGQFFTSAATAKRNLGYGDLGGGQVRVLYTIRGDANLDRSVTFDDLVTLAQNYNTASGAFYNKGDFTYDGAVNFEDLVVLAQNYNSTLSAAQLGDFSADFASDWALAQSLVPEPATLAILGLPIAMAARRRRQL